jgi:hypothetical protein
VEELRRQGIEPVRGAPRGSDPAGENLRNKVIRRAWQILREQEWIAEPAVTPPAGAGGDVDDDAITAPNAKVAELVLDDTTEPHFVIIEQTEN